ncbi:hypothetical protein GJ744_011945 [Endocarpon pusillum]|uniref:Pyruvate decarboxylase n=1 Tax=Endocarpon pusillum TaxID=364733 RepID=A0A8H7ATU7_9EURO|nr:hypothetical protein GJ744_011945 [Endocarpon pusillum]
MPSLPSIITTTTTAPPPSPSPKSTTVPLTTYLYTRLAQLGCRTLHGVPGDYNLTALDHCSPSPHPHPSNP